MSSVGRPPEVDSEGNTVQKCLVNVTIPTKLANFLKEKGINRSKFFRNCVTKLYKHEICNRCYSERIQETAMGWYCLDCTDKKGFHYEKGFTQHLAFKNCEHCGTTYQPPYNMFAQPKDHSFEKGCWDCIPEKDRS